MSSAARFIDRRGEIQSDPAGLFIAVRVGLVGAGIALAVLAWPHPAKAEIVRAPGVQLTAPKAYGAYTIVFTERSYDTTGVAVPPLTNYVIRLPVGMTIRREFLTRRFLCDGRKLREKKERAVCKHAQLGAGKAEVELLDANNQRLLDVPVPANLYFFLAKSTKKGAVGSMLILIIPDASAPIVRDNPSIKAARLIGEAPFFRDPTPDGLFDYRLELPVGVGGLRYNISRAQITFPGLTLRKRLRRCLKSTVDARVARCPKGKSRVRRVFWANPPKCPASGKLTFQATYGYLALPPTTITAQIPCLRFPGK